MTEVLSSLLLVIGGAFMLLAGVGIVRMPDLFMRMQAATKAATLGVGCMLFAVAVHFGELAITARCMLVTAFVFLTAPLAAHVIARAAYSIGVPLWKGTFCDELHDQKDQQGPPSPEGSAAMSGQTDSKETAAARGTPSDDNAGAA
ncbi:MAG TPA: monovalent cation/H(+) antiporter subunit G [Pirellulaceae bacterium]|nr:monovalent cation/H(+) antiporter subunit G [Pirellulaceae bacterium]